MNLIIKKEIIMELLKKISGGIKKNTTQKEEIFSNVFIKIIKDKIFCISTDNIIEIIAYDVVKNNNISIELLIEFKKFFNICKILKKNSNLEIISNKNQIEITFENNKFIINKINGIFPISPKENLENHFKIENIYLKKMFNKTIISIADNDSRIYLNGLLLKIKNNTLKLISSDSYRISQTSIKLENITKETEIIIPKKTILEYIQTFSDNDETNVYFSKKFIKFSTKKLTLISKLIESEYPNILETFKIEENNIIKINKNELKQAILNVKIICDEKNYKSLFLISNNNLTIIISNEHEQAITNLKIENTNINMQISLNIKFLLDIIEIIDSKEININFNDKNNPIIIKGSEFNETFAIMPFQI